MLERIKDMLCDELEQFANAEKINSAAELDQIDKLTHSLKSIETIMAMRGGEGSEAGGSYGGSYARGRSMRTGRYVSRDDGVGGKSYPPMTMRERY